MRWALIPIALGQHTVSIHQYTLLADACNEVFANTAQDVKNVRPKVMNHLLLLETDVPM